MGAEVLFFCKKINSALDIYPVGVYNPDRRDVPTVYNPRKGERDGRKDGKYLSAL